MKKKKNGRKTGDTENGRKTGDTENGDTKIPAPKAPANGF